MEDQISKKPSAAEKIREKFSQIADVFVAKNTDYGNSVFNPSILCDEVPPDIAILVRMIDNINRIATLCKSPANIRTESFVNMLHDLAGCSVLLAILLEKSDE